MPEKQAFGRKFSVSAFVKIQGSPDARLTTQRSLSEE
jgi:hypothetical protein